MTTSALIMIILTQGTVLAATIYFFRKVLKTPPKPEPDSYKDNDNAPRD
ncbi:MAG: hypothetical protein HOM43_05495 [Flavobacteriales bacterium]|jgi:hypothetical protein|nr:hypothetical protein [Flavobacteriales bacterium]MDA8994511.1 hypothetical protein [Schleiferiaceae bacterium]CAI8155509.1 MAG: Uncharacterised protein [Flavobacteriales bacterium UBA4585]MDP4616899.1 hypothetical protein [Schleiferiaceae bacterium]MDP4759984.1 hypothetical protein [Schleiferiaceae bacterium]